MAVSGENRVTWDGSDMNGSWVPVGQYDCIVKVMVGEFHYAARSWDQPRRVITRVEHTHKGTNPRYVITNLSGEASKGGVSPQELPALAQQIAALPRLRTADSG